MDSTTKKSQSKGLSDDRLIEQLRDIGKGVVKTVGSDLVSGVAGDALSSLFGTPIQGDFQPGQAINLNQKSHLSEPPLPQFLPEMPFFGGFRRQQEAPKPLYSQETLNRIKAQETHVAQKIEEIRMELKALVMVIKNVNREIELAVSEQIIDPGVYHINFLDRLKTILKLMRQNLNDSASWLRVMRSRKKERKYWSLYKKKGTEFGLNPDRVVSTQVG